MAAVRGIDRHLTSTGTTKSASVVFWDRWDESDGGGAAFLRTVRRAARKEYTDQACVQWFFLGVGQGGPYIHVPRVRLIPQARVRGALRGESEDNAADAEKEPSQPILQRSLRDVVLPVLLRYYIT